MQPVLSVADGCASWCVSSLPALLLRRFLFIFAFYDAFEPPALFGQVLLYAVFMMCGFAGAVLVAVAVGAGVVVVSAAKAAEERPIAAATTRANTLFIVIPSICFFIKPHCGAVEMTISREWQTSVSSWFQHVTVCTNDEEMTALIITYYDLRKI